MPRIRSIKPEFWTDYRMTKLPALARLVYVCLWSMADDDGRIEGDHETVHRFGGFQESSGELMSAIEALMSLNRVVKYEVEGIPYMAIPRWKDHQKIQHPTPSQLPAPPSDSGPHEDSRNAHEASIPRVRARRGEEGRGEEGKGEEGSRGDRPGFQLDRPEEFAQLIKRVEVIWSGDPGSFPAIVKAASGNGEFLAAWNDPPMGEGIPLRAWLDALPAYHLKRTTWNLHGLVTFARTQSRQPPAPPARGRRGEPTPEDKAAEQAAIDRWAAEWEAEQAEKEARKRKAVAS